MHLMLPPILLLLCLTVQGSWPTTLRAQAYYGNTRTASAAQYLTAVGFPKAQGVPCQQHA